VKSFLVLLLAVSSQWAFCEDSTKKFTPQEKISLQGDRVLVVTHASTRWDVKGTIKKSVDISVSFAKGNHIPVVYLQRNLGSSYYAEDQNPDYYVYSSVGEFSFAVPRTFITTGGYYSYCQEGTMLQLVRIWGAEDLKSDLRVCLIAGRVPRLMETLERASKTV
jgi:hypothetical protein